MIGKEIRLERIMDSTTGRSVMIALDHGFTLGQIKGLQAMRETISAVRQGGANAVIQHKGMVKSGIWKGGPDLGLIIHLSGSTSLNPMRDDKVLVCSVEEAITLGADAVSIQVNLGSPSESEMLTRAALVVRDCNRWGMPVLIMIYPRGEGLDPTSPQLIGHCVRVAEELGADLIKTSYPGDPQAFKEIVEACSVPILIAGGEREEDLRSLQMTKEALSVGGAGICFGRNVFQKDDPEAFVRALSQVVHKNLEPEIALERRG